MMRRILFILLIGVFLSPMALQAGIYGTLKGTVVDEKGEPVVGATVQIKGAGKGAITNRDGQYTIMNIRPGEWEVTATYIGYQEQIFSIELSADQILEYDINLSMNSVMTKEIVKIAKKIVDNTKVGQGTEVTSKDIEMLPHEGIQSLVSTSAGVSSSGNGFNIRGARQTETQIRVDGLDVGSQFSGGFGALGAAYYPMVSSFATEQVQVLTGGFGAEYGDAMGGIVNTVMKTGNTERYEGLLRWRTDFPALWGSQSAGLKLTRESEGSRLKAVDDGPGYTREASNEHNFDFGIGGPLPLPFFKKSTFYLSAVYFQEQYRNNSFGITDPAGNNLGQMPNNRSWKKNIAGRMKFAINDKLDFILGGMYGMTNIEYMGWSWLYATDPGMNTVMQDGQEVLVSNGIPEYVAKIPVSNQFVYNAMARINHRITDNSFYELTISHTSNNDESSKRIGNDDPSYFGGFDVWYPQDDYEAKISTLVPSEVGDRVIDQYSRLSKIAKTEDGYLDLDIPVRNPLTGYYEGDAYYYGTDNPYGRENAFVVHGNSRTFQFRRGSYWQLDGNYNLNVSAKDKNTGFSHMMKTGFEVRFYEQHRHQNSTPWDGLPFMDVYTDMWGGNFYTDGETREKTSQPFTPWKASAYIQDQITYKDIIISPGIRVDMFDPNSTYRTDETSFVPIAADSGFADASAKMQVSPRINIAYPLTETSNFTLSYGLYFKMPEMQNMFDAYNAEMIRPGASVIGSPNMEAQRTNQYQIGYNQQVGSNMGLSISAYYRDVYNQLGLQYIPAVPTPFYLQTVSDYGNSKGVEITFMKRANIRANDPLSFNINYTLAQVVGTASSAGSAYGLPVDPYTQKFAFPLSEFPMPWDRTHNLRFIIGLSWGQDQGPAIGDLHLLEYTNISLSTVFSSGAPYTRTDLDGNAIAEVNSERQPNYWTTSLRFSRQFRLSDYFGESVGHTSIEFFFDVYNLFNLTGVTGVYSRTGDPIDNGSTFSVEQGQFSAAPYYKEANYSIAETIGSSQYNQYGERLYSENADIDNNGIVTQLEKYKAFQRYVETTIQFRGNFQSPRSVYFGMIFRF